MFIEWIQWKEDMINRLLIILGILLLIFHIPSHQITQIGDDVITYTTLTNSIEFTVADKNFTLLNVKCKKQGIRSETPRKPNSFLCEHLQPCTEYLAVAKVQDLSYKTFDKNFTVKTSYAEPDIVFDMLLPSNDSIFLSWNATNSGCIFKVNIIVLNKGEIERNISLDSSNEHFEITGLYPCEKYDIILSVYDIHNVLVNNITTTMETSFYDPGVVQSLKFSETQSSSLILNWERPNYESCIEYYYLKWTKLDCILTNPEKCTWTYYNYSNPKGREFHIEKLESCVYYAIIITPNGDHMNNSIYATFEYPEQDKLGPVKGLAVNGSSTNVNISWGPPVNHSNCVKKYKINLIGPGFNKTAESNTTYITFDELKPCGVYNATVWAISLSDKIGEPNQIKADLPVAEPGVVQNLWVRAYPKDMTVKWKLPTFGELCIKNYNITGWYAEGNDDAQKFTEITDDFYITINGVVSCMKYKVQVKAITASPSPGIEGKVATVIAETEAMKSDPPEVPDKKLITHDSIEITTRDVDQTNRCPVLYARLTCETSEEGKIPFAEEIVQEYLTEFTAVLRPLSPATTYMCNVSLYNINDWSNPSKTRLTTLSYYPTIPEAVYSIPTSNTSLKIQWRDPKYSNGKVSLFKLYIQTMGPKYKIPLHCPSLKYQNVTQTVEYPLKEFAFKDALPFVQYSVQVAAKTDYGTGEYSPPVLVITDPWIPDPVENLTLIGFYGPDLDTTYRASVNFSWQLPCQANGQIVGFEGTFSGTRLNDERHDFNWSMNVNDPLEEDHDYFTFHETRLWPDFTYFVTVRAIVKGISVRSEEKHFIFTSPAGIPVLPSINETEMGSVNVFAAKNPTTSAEISFSPELLQSQMGEILYMAILVSEKDCQCDPTLKSDKIDSRNEWPEVPTWHDVHTQNCVTQYQTTPLRWNPLKSRNFARTIDPKRPIKYIIGQDNCSKKKAYCNGPLRPDTAYVVIMRLFTKSGYNDVAAFDFKTDSAIHLYFILLLIVTFLLFAFLVGFGYLWFTKRIQWHRDSINGIDDHSGDISAKNFLIHYDELIKKDKIDREFKELAAVANDLSLSNTASRSNENKNRYSNIFPYDKNRVILDCDSDGADYINASFINGYKHKKEYIATQGPKPESFVDFWKMILQYNVRVIVMLTQLRENDIIKCHPYFPHLLKKMNFGHNIEVRCTKQIFHDLYDRREMVVEHTGHGIVQKVVHYFFKKWLDHDCPNEPSDLINFIRKVKSEKTPNRTPIVVHCSAGVGRTGTFIGLDILMQRLKSEGRISIFETVKELRFQRMKMVQNQTQYQFLYVSIYQLVKKKFPSKVKEKDNDKDKEDNKTEELNLPSNANSAKRLSFSPNDIESVM